jgi:crotonobetainyl-CoA:carnitine CoA-transferase CaiB-like acyl-CoA transferase
LGEPALAQDPRYATNAARIANRTELIPHLQSLLVRWDQSAILAALDAAGVPAGPINTLSQVFANEQVVARKMAFTQHSDVLGEIPAVRCPLRFSEGETRAPLPPPALGAHTSEVLAAELNLTDSEITHLRKASIAM